MSYDLMVFDPEVAPKDKAEFMSWFEEIVQWGEGHDYDAPSNASENLQRWYRDMIKGFPAMNGPDFSEDNIDNDRITGYTCARHAIYADFRWNVEEQAYQAVRQLAEHHRLGFFDVSGDGSIWSIRPDGTYGRIG